MNKIAFYDGYIKSSVLSLDKQADAPSTEILPYSSDFTSKVFGNGIPGTVADIGTYFIPGVGTARYGYDTIADAANFFSKGLTARQRMGYALSTALGTAFTAAAILPGGGKLLSYSLKPVVAGLNKMKRGKKLLDKMRSGRQVYNAIRTGKASSWGQVYSAPLNYMLKPNPYGRKNPFKFMAYGTPRQVLPMAAYLGAGGLIASDIDKQNTPMMQEQKMQKEQLLKYLIEQQNKNITRI